MAEQSLIERVANRETKSLNTEEADVDTLIDSLRVSEGLVEYRSLDDDNWNRLADIKKFARSNFSDIIEGKDIILSDDQRSKLEEFGAIASSCWDSELEMFKIEYQTDADGDLKSLVVPLESDMSEDFVVQRIHDDSGNFVADGIEEQIDFEMYELWSKDMYVDSLDDESDVYVISTDTKGRVELFSESISNQSESFDQDEYLSQGTATEWFLKTALSVMASLGTILIFYFTFQYLGILGVALLFMFSMFGMIPLLIILTAVLEVLIGIEALNKSIKDKKEQKRVKLFETRSSIAERN